MNLNQNLLEPGVAHMPDEEWPALASIAISLKRIADTLDGTAAGLNIAETIFGRSIEEGIRAHSR